MDRGMRSPGFPADGRSEGFAGHAREAERSGPGNRRVFVWRPGVCSPKWTNYRDFEANVRWLHLNILADPIRTRWLASWPAALFCFSQVSTWLGWVGYSACYTPSRYIVVPSATLRYMRCLNVTLRDAWLHYVAFRYGALRYVTSR